MMLKMTEIKLHKGKDYDRLFGQNGSFNNYMKKKRAHRKHRRTQNFFCHHLPVFFLCHSVFSVGS